jgi:hypothetical protein
LIGGVKTKMNYYLIKYINQMWLVEKQFTQLASAEAHKELLDKRKKVSKK